MSIVKPVLGLTVGLQSLAIMGRGVSMIPRSIGGKGKASGKKMVRGFTDIMIGVGLLKPTASMVSSF